MSETVVELHIRAESLADLRDKLRQALGDLTPQTMVWRQVNAEEVAEAVQESAPPAAEPEKPKRQRKAKAEEAPGEPAPASAPPTEASSPESTAAPAAEEKPVPAAAPAEATPAAGSAVTHEQAKAAAEAFMANHPDGKDVAKKEIRGYLATYGVSRVAELAAKDLQSFMSDLEGV